MIPHKSFLNKFQNVHCPTVRDLFGRAGNIVPPPTTSDGSQSVIEPRKNDVLDDINRLADEVPVTEPDE